MGEAAADCVDAMDLEALQIVVAAAEHGSTLGVSKVLGLSRATIRRRIEALEERLGVALFHRTASGLVPTEAGQVLARRGNELLAGAEALAAAVREVGGTPHGELRCCVFAGAPPTLLVRSLGMIRRMFTGLQLRVQFGEPCRDKLLTEYDFILELAKEPALGPFESVPLLTTELRLLASAEYLRLRGPIARIEDLDAREILAWSSTPNATSTVRFARLDGPDLELTPGLVSNDAFMLRQMAIAGLGVAYTLDGYAEPLEAKGALEQVLPKIIRDQLHVQITVGKAVADTPRVRGALDLVIQLLELAVPDMRARVKPESAFASESESESG